MAVVRCRGSLFVVWCVVGCWCGVVVRCSLPGVGIYWCCLLLPVAAYCCVLVVLRQLLLLGG